MRSYVIDELMSMVMNWMRDGMRSVQRGVSRTAAYGIALASFDLLDTPP